MATTADTLIQRTRRFMGDWPDVDSLTASVTSGGTSLTVADSSLYGQNWILQIDDEALYVGAYASTGTAVAVRRGVRGTVAASHAQGATVLLKPDWLDTDYLDALNSGINATFPLLYKAYRDESITTVSGTYEYDVPLYDGSNPIPFLSKIEFKESGDLAFRPLRNWDVYRGSSPIIKFRRYLYTGILRVYGYIPLPMLTDVNDSLDALFPTNAEDALTQYAASYLLASGEARRVRQDTGAQDDRANATNVGSSLNASNAMLQRFQIRLQQSAMPALPKNIKSVF